MTSAIWDQDDVDQAPVDESGDDDQGHRVTTIRLKAITFLEVGRGAFV